MNRILRLHVQTDENTCERRQERQERNSLTALTVGLGKFPDAEVLLFFEDDILFNRHLVYNLQRWAPLRNIERATPGQPQPAGGGWCSGAVRPECARGGECADGALLHCARGVGLWQPGIRDEPEDGGTFRGALVGSGGDAGLDEPAGGATGADLLPSAFAGAACGHREHLDGRRALSRHQVLRQKFQSHKKTNMDQLVPSDPAATLPAHTITMCDFTRFLSETFSLSFRTQAHPASMWRCKTGGIHERRHDELYVVACVFNPRRFESRVRLFHEFENYVASSGAKLFVVEAAFGDRRHEVTSPTNPMHLQVRTNVELWHKERLLNLGVQRLPPEAKYVAWVDPDVHFTRHDWANETVHMLQHHPVVQMFGQAANLGPNEEVLWLARGMAKGWQEYGKPVWECPETVLRGREGSSGPVLGVPARGAGRDGRPAGFLHCRLRGPAHGGRVGGKLSAGASA